MTITNNDDYKKKDGENMQGRIYIHKNKLNGKCYVGQTIQKPQLRWGRNGKNYRADTKFGLAIKKYGWNNFEHIIIPTIYETINELNKAEEDFIFELDSFENGYNSTPGGDNKAVCPETREKLSKGQLGSLNHMYGRNGKDHPNYGKKISDEQRELISLNRTGMKASEETKLKMSENKKGSKNSFAKSVKIIDTENSLELVFGSIREASTELNINYDSLKSALSKNKTSLLYKRYKVSYL